jgi:uncharacterized membrane protein YdjX (TVP38/TMEM64 family)
LTVKGGGRHFAAMPETEPPSKRALVIKLALLAVVVVAGAVLLLRGIDVKALAVRVMALIGNVGPWGFFIGMALLPAAGFPLSLFALAAGPAFSERLGVGGVIAAYGAALAVNLLLTYWIARWGLRPWIERMVARFGYKIPQFDPEEQLEVTVLLRITPGPPFFVQSYLLGLGNVAFGTYLLVSWSIVTAQGVGIVVFGDAIMHGKGGMAMLGVSLVLAAAIIIHLVRKHLGRRRKAAPR